MKNIFICMKLSIATIAIVSSLFVSCQKEEEAIKSVDLRYEAEDEYLLTHSSPEAITIRVRSTDNWEVYSQNPEWSTITPSSGEADPTYDPDKNYDVVITYTDNKLLDDREDIIYIKSDYWIGKEIRVTQKGTAYLDVDLTSTNIITKAGGETSVGVLSNQEWTSAITKGDSWLEITSGTSGSMDGIVTVSTLDNKGEIRVGEMTIYDRLGVAQQVVSITQDGTVLTVNQSAIFAYHQSQTLTIPVESNGDWFVEKEDEITTWFEIEGGEFSGNGEIKILLNENGGSTTRKSKIIVSTVLAEGVDPVVKEITLRQAYLPVTTRNEFTNEFFGTFELQNGSMDNMTSNGDFATFLGEISNRVTRYNQPLGRYTFSLKALGTNAAPSILLYAPDYGLEITASVSATETVFWGRGISNISQAACSMTEENALGIELSENLESGLTNVEWFLNGVSVSKHIATSDSDFEYQWGTPITQLIIGNACWSGEKDAVEFYWMEYTPPIDWDM
ncbi:MAG: BACON domain-containing carbohydrate-binding protein [Rikenellaceae bacterium]